MKRILHLDATAGVSGDMFVGALLDLGVDLEEVRRDLATLNLEGFRIRTASVTRQGLMGTKFEVIDSVTGRDVDELHHHHKGEQRNHHRHHHDNHLGDHERHDHDHEDRLQEGYPGKEPTKHEHRSLVDIRGIIQGSGLAPKVAADALAIFQILGRAEALVHGVAIEEVHFHEVGALDAIVDIVAAASALHRLGVDEVTCSPLHVGSGTVRCAHGLLPVPAPATLEILKGIPIYASVVQGELVTPTGAAILKHFCSKFTPLPPMVVEAIGYGAGAKEREIPNLLRAMLGVTSA